MANIKDVAKMANVSVATVSRVFNKTSVVSPEVEMKVRRAAETLGYTPNLLGKNLRQNRTGTIFVMMSSLTNSFCSKVVTGIANEAEKYNYHIMVCVTNLQIKQEKMYLELVKNHIADGMIVLNSRLSGKEMALVSNNATIVQCSEYTENDGIPYVSINNFAAAKDACERLISNGKKRIAYIGVNNNLASSKLRYDGYCKALEEHGIPYDENLVIISNYGYRHTISIVDDFLDRNIEFDAIFAISDRMAFGAITAMKRRGINVPEDVEVIGFDNTDIAYMVEPSLTTIAQPQTEMGKCAFSLIHEKLKGNEPENIFLPHELIVRKSAK